MHFCTGEYCTQGEIKYFETDLLFSLTMYVKRTWVGLSVGTYPCEYYLRQTFPQNGPVISAQWPTLTYTGTFDMAQVMEPTVTWMLSGQSSAQLLFTGYKGLFLFRFPRKIVRGQALIKQILNLRGPLKTQKTSVLRCNWVMENNKFYLTI